jgi:hypothetical protein
MKMNPKLEWVGDIRETICLFFILNLIQNSLNFLLAMIFLTQYENPQVIRNSTHLVIQESVRECQALTNGTQQTFAEHLLLFAQHWDMKLIKSSPCVTPGSFFIF